MEGTADSIHIKLHKSQEECDVNLPGKKRKIFNLRDMLSNHSHNWAKGVGREEGKKSIAERKGRV